MDAIAGGVVGGVFALAVLAVAVFVQARRSRNRANIDDAASSKKDSRPTRSRMVTVEPSAPMLEETREMRAARSASLPGLAFQSEVDVEAPLSSNSAISGSSPRYRSKKFVL